MEKIFVCAGMKSGNNPNFFNQATKLGELMAKNKVIYAQGGSTQGLMGATLKEFRKYSKDIEIYLPKQYFAYDLPDLINTLGKNTFKVIKIKNELDRLTRIFKCDKIVVLPGGTGTLLEMLYINEMNRSKKILDKIYIVNIDGFYDEFIKQINNGIKTELITADSIAFKVVNSVEEIPF